MTFGDQLVASTPDAPWLPPGSTAEVWACNSTASPEPAIVVRLLLTRVISDCEPELFCVEAAKGLDLHTFTLTRLALPDLPPHFLAVRQASNVDQLPARLNRLQREWRLTAKQTAVLGRLATGLSNKSLALELSCAEGTVETHVTALLNKSATESRAELIARFWTTG